MKAIKAFFSKVWAWVLAHKIVAGVIAGAVTLAIVTAIVVPVSVSSARKKRAEETQQTDNGGSQPNGGGQGGQQGGGSQGGGDSTPAHVHVYGDLVAASAADCTSGGHAAYYYCEGCKKYFDENKVETTWEALVTAAIGHDYQFDSFVWTETPGAYTAKAKYVCSHDNKHVDLRDATVTKNETLSVAQVCEEEHPKNVWKASLDGHEETRTENLAMIHHDWQVSSWEWSGYSTAQAHFVCSHDPNHIHDETATGGDITSEVTTPANCSTAGERTYTASVTFGGQEYTNTKTEVIAATGVHTVDSWGFCTSGGEYTGDTKSTLNTNFAVDASGEYFFRIPILGASHYYFCLENNELQGVGAAKAGILVDGVMQELDNGMAFTDEDSIDAYYFPELISITAETGDGYMYVRLEEADNSGLHFNMKASDEHLVDDRIGLCVAEDYYEGATPAFGEELHLGSEDTPGHYHLGTDETVYFQFDACEGHTYAVDRHNISVDDIAFYYKDALNGGLADLHIAGGMITLPDDGTYDNDYLFVMINPIMALDDATLKLRIIGHSDDCADDYGFCTWHDDSYTGDQLPSDGQVNDIDISAGGVAFFATEIEVGHKYRFYDPSDEINYACFSAYTRNPLNGAMTEVQLTHDSIELISETPVFDDVGDGNLYIVVSADFGNIVDGIIDITTVHHYVHGICDFCFYTPGLLLEKDTASDPFDLDVGETVYFYYEVEGSGNPDITINFSVTQSGGCVTLYVVRDNEITEMLYDGGNIDYESFFMPDSDPLVAGEKVYIELTNNDNTPWTNQILTVEED